VLFKSVIFIHIYNENEANVKNHMVFAALLKKLKLKAFDTRH
jgi:hypothetical protein